MTCCHLQQRFRFYLHHCDSRLDQRYQLSESTETTDAAVACSINCWRLKNKWWEMHALCKLKLSTRTWSRYVNRRADQHTHTHSFFRTVDVERGRSVPGLTTTFPISSPSQALCISQVQIHGSFKCHTPASEARHDHLCLLVHHPKSHGDGGL